MNKYKIFDFLETIAPAIPINMYWFDKENKVMGGNQLVVKDIGGTDINDYVGKTLFEIYPEDIAQQIVDNMEEVKSKNKAISFEETIKDLSTNQTKHFRAFITPLHDDSGNIIGTMGTSLDITAEKESEVLRIENIEHKAQLEQKDKFFKIAKQVAHDIRSPLASLLMIVKSCTDIPENERIALREAAMGIEDIANNLLAKYVNKSTESSLDEEQRRPKLVSAVLLQLITDKKYQYNNLSIKLLCEIDEDSHFAFINVAPSFFRRMISNIINNAVDAVEKDDGKVTVKLRASNEWVYIEVIDNGKGMPPELIDKILKRESVTHGKQTGHGIGLTQVHESLEQSQAEMLINSIQNEQTTITLKFPRIKAPEWVAEEIKLTANDLVVILDDDHSIHGAWESRFEKIIQENPNITLKHFQTGSEAISFMNNLSDEEKEQVFLLSDYELLKQGTDGLEIIEASNLKRSILVTSHYADPIVRDRAAKIGTKILPKQLAPEVPIVIDYDESKSQDELSVDLVIVDDDPSYVQTLEDYVLPDRVIDKYYDPRSFLANIAKYRKDTLIVLDNNLGSGYNGFDIARDLNSEGFNNLYLLTGDIINPDEVPEYLKVINKSDLDSIGKLV